MNSFTRISALILFIFHCAFPSKGEHIVFFLTASSYSHRVALWSFVEALVNKGHNVTFLSPTFGKKDCSHPLVKDVHLPGALKWVEWTRDSFDINMRIQGFEPPFVVLEHLAYLACNAAHEDDNFKDWLKETKKVDLIFADSTAECTHGLAKTTGAKHAISSVIPFYPKIFESYGFPAETSSMPNLVMTQALPITFFRRVINALLPLATRALQVLEYEFFYKKTFEQAGFVVPDLYEMERETALYLMNSDYLDDYPRSVPPFVVRVPGMHVNRAKGMKLDPVLEKFISDGNSQSFVYISFGTFVDASEFPSWFIEMFLKTIESLPNLRFVWVWKHEFKGVLPPNLMIVKWTAQHILLAHPKIKAFIFQGGRPSGQEAFYHGVPTIVIPIIFEQEFNAHNYARFGTSVVLEIGNITKEVLLEALDRVVNNTVLISKLKRLSDMYKDVTMSSIDKAVWWTEFVLRHSTEELRLLKPLAQNQYWFQRRELDVWLFILICTATFSWLNYFMTKFLFKKCLDKFASSKEKNKSE